MTSADAPSQPGYTRKSYLTEDWEADIINTINQLLEKKITAGQAIYRIKAVIVELLEGAGWKS